jgi:hypothetical protein
VLDHDLRGFLGFAIEKSTAFFIAVAKRFAAVRVFREGIRRRDEHEAQHVVAPAAEAREVHLLVLFRRSFDERRHVAIDGRRDDVRLPAQQQRDVRGRGAATQLTFADRGPFA